MVLKLFVFHIHHPEKLKRQNLKTQMLISGRNSEIENPSILLTMTRLLIKKKNTLQKDQWSQSHIPATDLKILTQLQN